mmetsp:Transcript_5404/g.7287  ORF Transcript_5404/g.7287 Transcript_5404/m.7287 type:complete len:227 (-) Transcript_5404:153-833(-)
MMRKHRCISKINCVDIVRYIKTFTSLRRPSSKRVISFLIMFFMPLGHMEHCVHKYGLPRRSSNANSKTSTNFGDCKFPLNRASVLGFRVKCHFEQFLSIRSPKCHRILSMHHTKILTTCTIMKYIQILAFNMWKCNMQLQNNRRSIAKFSSTVQIQQQRGMSSTCNQSFQGSKSSRNGNSQMIRHIKFEIEIHLREEQYKSHRCCYDRNNGTSYGLCTKSIDLLLE